MLTLAAALAAESPESISPSQPSLAAPSAAPLDAGDGQAGVGGVAIFNPDWPGPLVVGYLRGAVGLADRFSVSGFGFYSVEAVGGAVSLRFDLVQKPGFHFAPFVGGGAFATLDTPLSGGGFFGFALEGGGTTVRFDASLPFIGALIDATPTILSGWALLGGTVGVTFNSGGGHSLRLGVDPGFSPALAWQYAASHWYARAGVEAFLAAWPAVDLEAGARF